MQVHLDNASKIRHPDPDPLRDRALSFWGDDGMHTLILSLVGLIGGVLWLLLLVATRFNVVVVGAGLLVTLYVIGNTREDTPHHPGRGSHLH